MTDRPPHPRTAALITLLFGTAPITDREYRWLAPLACGAGMVIGFLAASMLPSALLVVFLGLLLAAMIWLYVVVRAWIRWIR